MRKPSLRSILTAAALSLALSPAPFAFAGESYGYPQVVHGERFESESYSQRTWSGEDDGYRSGYDDRDDGSWDDGRWAGGYRERWSDQDGMEGRDGHRFHPGRRYVDDGGVGYLPLSFFADAGGVGPAYIDYGDYGGGGGYIYGGAFAGARAGASVSARISIMGGFRGRGGFHHHGGHGCGCK